jgi:hypothetical protein
LLCPWPEGEWAVDRCRAWVEEAVELGEREGRGERGGEEREEEGGGRGGEEGEGERREVSMEVG